MTLAAPPPLSHSLPFSIAPSLLGTLSLSLSLTVAVKEKRFPPSFARSLSLFLSRSVLSMKGPGVLGPLSLSLRLSLLLSSPLAALPGCSLAGRRGGGGGGGGNGDGGMRRGGSISPSLPLFFLAIPRPQKQERLVHLQVVAFFFFHAGCGGRERVMERRRDGGREADACARTWLDGGVHVSMG